MELKEYIKQIIAQFIEADDQEVPDVKPLDFDIGLDNHGLVQNESTNRIKFTLLVKRA